MIKPRTIVCLLARKIILIQKKNKFSFPMQRYLFSSISSLKLVKLYISILRKAWFKGV